MLLFIGFVVVMCVISEAAGKAADRQKGKAIVRRTDSWKERQSDTVVRMRSKLCLVADDAFKDFRCHKGAL